MLIGFTCCLLLALDLFTGVKFFRQILIYIIPFYIGMAVKKYELIGRIFRSQTVLTLCITVGVLLTPLYDMNDKSNTVLIIRFIVGLAYTEVFWCFANSGVCRDVPGNSLLGQVKRGLEYFGRHSLEIYLISEFFRRSFVLSQTMNAFPDTLLRIIYAVVICYTSILISKLLSQSRILRFLLFGGIPAKWREKKN